MYWNQLVTGVCVLLLVVLLWKETRRADTSLLVLRIIATVLSVTSLACLILRVTIGEKQKITDKIAILLSEGYNSDSVQKILSSHREVKIYTTEKNERALNTVYINDLGSLAELAGSTGAIHIFGYGYTENDLSLLKNIPLVFHPAAIGNTITSVNWTQYLASGEPLVVQGSFINGSRGPVKVILSGLNTNLDSMNLQANQSPWFQLSTAVKHLDNAVYSLTFLSGKDTIEKEPIPVNVKIKQPIKILILSGSPDFENTFLKNWLAKNGYKFIVRTKTSTNKYDRQYVNISTIPVDRITPSLLDIFDCIIADASELAGLPGADIVNISNYIKDKGMGLIVKADTVNKYSAFYLRSFPLVETRDSVQHSVSLNFGDSGKATFPLKIEQPVYIREVAGTQPLAKDQLKQTVASSNIYGAGRVVITTIPNSFAWQLSGNNNDYNAYWTLLLKKAARKTLMPHVWTISPALPEKNEAVQIKLQTGEVTFPRVQTGEDKVYMQQDHHLAYEWQGRYWPTKAGWQSLVEGEGAIYWWYVYDNNHWKGIRRLDKIKATTEYANVHPYKPGNTFFAVKRREIPKIYFLMFFIVSAGFLWFDNKNRRG